MSSHQSAIFLEQEYNLFVSMSRSPYAAVPAMIIQDSPGFAAYQKGMFIPIASTFFMFWLHTTPDVRMSALQGLRFIGIATHDSIGIAEDGPTHQRIALEAFYRALPNLSLIRPCDAEEVVAAYEIALDDSSANTPSLFCLSREAVPLLEGSDLQEEVSPCTFDMSASTRLLCNCIDTFLGELIPALRNNPSYTPD